MQITAHAHAKINLFLKVTGKRADGYHEIKSVFQKVTLSDILVLSKTIDGEIVISCDDPAVPIDSGNLVAKAAHLLQSQAGAVMGATIEIKKRVPVAAGLGGGSGDAAIAIKALCGLWGVDKTDESISNIALSIGADVPFFLGGPCAFVSGIGEKIEQLTPKKSAPLLLINPGFGISSADAYKNSKFSFAPFEKSDEMVEDIESGEPLRIAKWMENDLEPWALATYPKLTELKKKVEGEGALRVMMSGSGPTLFAIYETEELRNNALEALKDAAPFVTAVETLIERRRAERSFSLFRF